MFGPVFPFAKSEIFKPRFCSRQILKGRERPVLGEGGDVNRGRRLGGDKGGVAMVVLWSSCDHGGNGAWIICIRGQQRGRWLCAVMAGRGRRILDAGVAL